MAKSKKPKEIQAITFEPDCAGAVSARYTPDGFRSWVYEALMEGYKQNKNIPFPSLAEAISVAEDNRVEVKLFYQ